MKPLIPYIPITLSNTPAQHSVFAVDLVLAPPKWANRERARDVLALEGQGKGSALLQGLLREGLCSSELGAQLWHPGVSRLD